jgi:excisionase family DNA binding protein
MAAQTAQEWRQRSTITVEEAAPILGIGRSSAYDLARSGEIPTLRLGRRLVVPVAALRRLLGENQLEVEPGGQTGLDEKGVQAPDHEPA